jgi:sirohydrochlorin ferrochelatase
MADNPILIGCAHGSISDEGKQVIRDLLDAVRIALPDVEVREAYVDIHGPTLEDVIADIPEAQTGTSAVVVPLFLGDGFLAIAKAVEARDDVVSAAALGPDTRLVDAVLDRLREEHTNREATVVLASTGSLDPRLQADTLAAAETLRGAWAGPVRVGFAHLQEPSVAQAVEAAREFGEEGVVAVASFLIAPGDFHDALQDSGADVVTRPLAPHPDIVSIVIDRYSSPTRA